MTSLLFLRSFAWLTSVKNKIVKFELLSLLLGLVWVLKVDLWVIADAQITGVYVFASLNEKWSACKLSVP